MINYSHIRAAVYALFTTATVLTLIPGIMTAPVA